MEEKNKEYLGVEGYELMGAAFEVHRELNGGLSEDGARKRGDGKSGRFARNEVEGDLSGCPLGSERSKSIRKVWSGNLGSGKCRLHPRRNWRFSTKAIG